MVTITEGMTAQDLCFHLAGRFNQEPGPNWTIVEKLPSLHLGDKHSTITSQNLEIISIVAWSPFSLWFNVPFVFQFPSLSFITLFPFLFLRISLSLSISLSISIYLSSSFNLCFYFSITGRILEDHEKVLRAIWHWPRFSEEEHILFKNNPEKYYIIKRPQVGLCTRHNCTTLANTQPIKMSHLYSISCQTLITTLVTTLTHKTFQRKLNGRGSFRSVKATETAHQLFLF